MVPSAGGPSRSAVQKLRDEVAELESQLTEAEAGAEKWHRQEYERLAHQRLAHPGQRLDGQQRVPGPGRPRARPALLADGEALCRRRRGAQHV